MTSSVDLVRLFGFLGGAPATLLSLTLLPWTLHATSDGFFNDPWFAAFNLTVLSGAIFAISIYWNLALRTVQRRHYNFGIMFTAAVVVATALALLALVFLPVLAFVASLPASLGAAYLCREQALLKASAAVTTSRDA